MSMYGSLAMLARFQMGNACYVDIEREYCLE